MEHPLSFVITESSQVGAARRAASALAASLGFNETKQGKIALIVTEVGNNLMKHAGQGELLLRVLEEDGIMGLELLALDKGPGMSNIARCLEDGYSTAGTPGNGLGAIDRLSHEFHLYSAPGVGTVLMARLWEKPGFQPRPAPLEYGVVHRAKPGQEICGDFWSVIHLPERSIVFLADGLGHGPEAALASREAVRLFRRVSGRRPQEILEAVHQGLSATRGAAAAVAELNHTEKELRFAGIGNIAGAIIQPGQSQSQGLVSHNGIVGHRAHKITEFAYPWPTGAFLLLYSDGLSYHGKLDRYTGLLNRHPSLIAGTLYRDFQRLTDDTTVLVARVPDKEQMIPE